MSDDVWVVMESGYVIEKSQPIVMLFSRNYNNQYETVTHKFAFKPYFYAPYDELYKLNFDDPRAKLIIEHSIDPTVDAKGREIFKCITRIPSDVPKCRDLFSWTDESDVLFDKRFLIDHRIKYAYQIINGIPQPYEVHHPMKPRILYLDIEVVSPQGDFPYPSNAKYPIISIQTLDNYTEKIAVFTSQIPKVDDEQIACKDEYELYKIFTTYVKQIDPDILAIWNGDQFDLPYLFNRAKILGININGIQRYDQCFTKYVQRTDAKGKVHASWRNKIPGRASLDMMEAFKKYNIGSAQRESNGLKSVISDKELLKEKAFSYQDIGYMLDKIINVDKRYDDFIAYCKNDVIALKTIDDKLGLYEFFETIRLVAGNKINDGLYNSLIIDGFLMYEGIKPMPRKTYGEKSAEEEFEGALVIEPIIGIHDWVANVDLNALYPHIVVGFNVSPDIDGIVAKSTKKLMDLRERYREEKRQGLIGASSRDAAAKALANSVYGVIGSKSFRLFDRTKAEFVTSTGKQLNIYIQKLCKDLNKKIVYGDSVARDTQIKLYKSDNSHNLTNIEDLFTHVDTVGNDGKEYCILDDCYVESVDDNGKVILDKIKCVMRHKCNKKMYRVYITNSHYIDVTEDHSLAVYGNKAVIKGNVKQKDRLTICKTGDLGKIYKSVILKRKTLHENISSMNYPLKLYEYIGYHIGDGSLFGKNNSYNGVNISFCSHKKELYDYFIPFLIENEWVENIIKSNKNYDVFNLKGSSKFAKFLYKNVGHAYEKHLPDFIFKETRENIAGLIRGYFSADGTVMIRDNMPIIRLTSISEDLISGVKELLTILGIASNYFKETNPNSYKGKVSNTYSYHLTIGDYKKFMHEVGFLQSFQINKYNSCKLNDYKVEDEIDWTYSNRVKIEEIEYNDYVYDLTTEKTHKFFANNVLATNTDSVFLSEIRDATEFLQLESYLNEKLKEWSIEHNSTVTFKLKAEKIFKRLLFKPKQSNKDKAGKKKYAGQLVWNEGKDVSYLKYMGLEIKRSDNSNITKDCLNKFLTYLLIDGDQERAVTYVRNSYRDVRRGMVSILDVSIPKEIRQIKYDGKNSWVLGKINAHDKYNYNIQEGEKPRLVYLLNDEVICIDEEFDVELIRAQIDWDKMADKTIKSKLESYFWAIGEDWNSAVNGQQKLNGFFG